MPDTKARRRPLQARAVETEKLLLDAFESLLRTKSFSELTVAEVATRAGVTTGAIYRRFAGKEDLLRSTFVRFYERTRQGSRDEPGAFDPGLTDRQVVQSVLEGSLTFTLEHVHLMKAANSLNDTESFELMLAARTVTAERMARRLQSSSLADAELTKRCKFVLRVATATFRDTFIAGRAAVDDARNYRTKNRSEMKSLISDLTEMASGYLQIE